MAAKKKTQKWTLVFVMDTKKKLKKIHREQLAVLATFYDGLATTPETIPTGLLNNKWVKLSKVMEDGKHRFDLWMIGMDSGCLFWKNDAEPVGIEIIQGGFGPYPKKGWVKRGLALDLRHLAWELAHRDGKKQPAYVVLEPEPKPQKTKAFVWKARRKRKTPDDYEAIA